MPKIIGIIPELQNIDKCWITAKPSSPWLGVSSEVRIFPVANGQVSIELPATPRDKVWIIGVSSAEEARYISPGTESWAVPLEDCDVTQIRNFSLAYVKFLEKENAELKLKLASLSVQQEDPARKPIIKPRQEVNDFARLAAHNIENLS